MNHIRSNAAPSTPAKATEKHFLVSLLKWIALIIVLLLAIFFATRPLRLKGAHNFVLSGDKYLLSKKYLQADLEYQKSLILAPTEEALSRRRLAELASSDITNLNQVPSDKNNNIFAEIAKAEEFPGTEDAAVKQSRDLIEVGEFQLAIIPAKTATQMDPQYTDAWLYLGIANTKTAESSQLTPVVTAGYYAKAKEAFQKALALDPENQTAKDYLGKI